MSMTIDVSSFILKNLVILKIVTIEVVKKDTKETANSTNSEASVNVAQIANSNMSKITLLKIKMRRLKV